MVTIAFISLCILMSVLWFVVRIFYHFKKQQILPLKLMTKIGTFYSLFIFALYFYNFQNPFQFWLLGFGSLLPVPFFLFCFLRFHQNKFYGDFLRFLSSLILSMKGGLSFSRSMEKALERGNWKQRQLLQRIYEHVVFSQQKPTAHGGAFGQFLNQVLFEFTMVNENQHLAIDRLCKFRKNLMERSIFRQKSGQIWGYFFYQMGILTLIYLVIFIFVVQQYGFWAFKKSFCLSFLFYFSGTLFTFFVVGRKKWSI